MLCMLIAYVAAGDIIATLDQLVLRDDGRVIGLLDFEAVEDAGQPLRLREDGSAGVWNVPGAVGSGTWPEWIGARAHDFSVELAPSGVRPKITALVHQQSGYRRERSAIDEAIAVEIASAREAAAARAEDPDAAPADLRAILGGPGRPLLLDDAGRTLARPEPPERPRLPLIGAKPSETL